MPIKYIRNWELKSFDDIIDVRSPNEYQEDPYLILQTFRIK